MPMQSVNESTARRWQSGKFYFAALALVLCTPATITSASEVVFETTVALGCFPTLMQPPPCPVPVGADDSIVASNPSGELGIRVLDNDYTLLDFNLQGLKDTMVVTAWFVHFRPDLGPTDPIFEPVSPGLPPVAFMDTPVAPTWARFSEGLAREPNQLRIKGTGDARLFTTLDYNPLRIGQVPLVNGATVNQTTAAGTVAEQGPCCPNFPAGPRIDPIGGSYLRVFDPTTGLQVKDHRGRPALVRSPQRPVAIALFVHIDGMTSGLVPGVAVPPFVPDLPVTAGSFYLLGIFPLGPIMIDGS